MSNDFFRETRIAVIGLGYVGLPVAIAFAQKFHTTVGFDINAKRVEALRQGYDWTGEASRDMLATANFQVPRVRGDL